MARSIFIGPAKYPEDGPANLQIRLNQELAQAYADYPLAATYFPLENIGLTAEGTSGAVDSPAELQRKLGGALTALAVATGVQVPGNVPSAPPYGGLAAPFAAAVNAYLLGLRPASAEPLLGYNLALDFKNGVYRSDSTVTTDLTAVPGYGYARSGTKYELAPSGQFIAYGSNVPGVVPGLGYFARVGWTNFVPNSQFVGANAANGAAATGWNYSGTPGTVVGTGVVNGLSFADVRFTLDNSAGTGVNYRALSFAPTALWPTTTLNDPWSCSVWLQLIAGAFNPSGGSNSIQIREHKLDGTYVTNANVQLPGRVDGTGLREVAFSSPIKSADTQRVQLFMEFGVPAGTVFDLTIRIAAPSLTKTIFKAPYVPTPVGGTATVTQDAMTFANNLPQDEDWIVLSAVNYTMTSAVDTLNRRFWQYNNSGGAGLLSAYRNIGGGQLTAYTNYQGTEARPAMGTFATTGRCVTAVRHLGGTFKGSSKQPDGSIVHGGALTNGMPQGIANLGLGNGLESVVEFFGYRRGTFSDAATATLLQNL